MALRSCRIALSIAMLVAGGILIGASLRLGDAAAVAPSGGTLRILRAGDFDFTDPALATNPQIWNLLNATCARLVTYRDRSGQAGLRLVPEVARTLPAVSRDGRMYTFQLRRSFRFNTGAAVGAANFAHAIVRALRPEMLSPAAAYLHEVEGADLVLSGAASTPTGVKAKGTTLQIRLTRRVPDFLERLTMPFFCAVPLDLPFEPRGIEAYPSAGPYYVDSWIRGRSLVVKRNPYYRGSRARGPDEFQYLLGQPTRCEQFRLVIEKGDADYGFMAPNCYVGMPQQYGVNKSQFFLGPGLEVQAIAMNTSRPLFANNPRLRRAVNYAIDRRALAAQGGVFSARRADHYLPPTMPGFRPTDVYPATPDIPMAQSLARGHTRGGKAVMYALNAGTAPQRALIVQQNLKQIGIEVEITLLSGNVRLTKLATRGEPFDLADVGLSADYGDPIAVLSESFDGRNIREANNTNLAYFSSRWFNRNLDATARLRGAERLRALGKLDVELARTYAPMAAYAVMSRPAFFSKRVGCVTIHPIYWVALNALCIRE
jgi:ABC-type oligopeptide transport system substrate-binding subunit